MSWNGTGERGVGQVRGGGRGGMGWEQVGRDGDRWEGIGTGGR